MKYLISLFTVIIIVTACNSQKLNKMNIPKINNEPERFEKSLFTKEQNKVDRTIKKLKKADNEIDTVYVISSFSRIEERDKEGNLLIYYSSGGLGSDGTISGYDYSLNPIIGIYKEFHPNGNIRLKGIYCWFGFKIGEWFYYDEEANLIKSENFDDGYSFTHEMLFKYCEENKISLEKVTSGYRTHISKYQDNNGIYFWYIKYPDIQNGIYSIIKMSGETGKIVERDEEALPYEE